MEKVRFAVVGAGWISQEAFLPSIHAVPNAEVTAIVSGSRDAAVRLAEFHGVRHVFGYEEYDAVLACLPRSRPSCAIPNAPLLPSPAMATS